MMGKPSQRRAAKFRELWADPDYRAKQTASIKEAAQARKVDDTAERLCQGCKQILPPECFSIRADRVARNTGRQRRSRCKNCEAQAASEYRARNQEYVRESRRNKWTKATPEDSRRWLINRYARICGLPREEMHRLITEHGPYCDICGRRQEEVVAAANRLHIDHDHETGAYRGMLCSDCNMTLGKFRDQPDILRRAADYLERPR